MILFEWLCSVGIEIGPSHNATPCLLCYWGELCSGIVRGGAWSMMRAVHLNAVHIDRRQVAAYKYRDGHNVDGSHNQTQFK